MNNLVLMRHKNGAVTYVMGFDHLPYAYNSSGLPPEIMDAARTGFALHLDDIDCRQVEWQDELPTRSYRVSHIH